MNHILKTAYLLSFLLCNTLHGSSESDDERVLEESPALFYLAAQAAQRLKQIHDDLYKDVATIRNMYASLKAAESNRDALLCKTRLLEEALIAADLEKRRNAQKIALLCAGLDWKEHKKFRGAFKNPTHIINICESESTQSIQPRTARMILNSHIINSELYSSAHTKSNRSVIFTTVSLPKAALLRKSKTVRFAIASDKKAPTYETDEDESDIEKETEFKHTTYH